MRPAGETSQHGRGIIVVAGFAENHAVDDDCCVGPEDYGPAAFAFAQARKAGHYSRNRGRRWLYVVSGFSRTCVSPAQNLDRAGRLLRREATHVILGRLTGPDVLVKIDRQRLELEPRRA